MIVGAMGLAVSGTMTVTSLIAWARGQSLLRDDYTAQSEPTAAFLESLPQRIDRRLPGVGVVMTATAGSIPPVLLNVVRRFRAIHRTFLLTTVTTEEIPHVTDDDRWHVEPLGAGLYRVMLRYGFMDEPHVHQALVPVLESVAPGTTTVTHMLGQERVLAGVGGQMGRTAELLFRALSRNASNPSDFFDLPPSQVVEIGSRVDL